MRANFRPKDRTNGISRFFGAPVAEGADLERATRCHTQDCRGQLRKLSRVSSRSYSLLSMRLAQLSPGGFHIARRLLAKQDSAEFVCLVIARGEFFLCIRALNINAGRQHAEITNKIDM